VAKTNITIEARVFRAAKRPTLVPSALWVWLAHKHIAFTGRWENLGTIAKSEDGNIVQVSPSSAKQ